METEIGVSFEEILPPTNTATQLSFWFIIKIKKLRFQQKHQNSSEWQQTIEHSAKDQSWKIKGE
jgi:hypothetical protein